MILRASLWRCELSAWGVAEALRLAEAEARIVDRERDDLLARGARVVVEINPAGHLIARPWRAEIDT